MDCLPLTTTQTCLCQTTHLEGDRIEHRTAPRERQRTGHKIEQEIEQEIKQEIKQEIEHKIGHRIKHRTQENWLLVTDRLWLLVNTNGNIIQR